MRILKLSLLRSTLLQVPLGPCLPTAKRLSRAGVPAARASGPRWPRHSGTGTCPPLAAKNGHNPSMSIARCQEWTCSVRLDAKSEHVHRVRHLGRPSPGHALPWPRRLDIIPACPSLDARNGHVPPRSPDQWTIFLNTERDQWTCPSAAGATTGHVPGAGRSRTCPVAPGPDAGHVPARSWRTAGVVARQPRGPARAKPGPEGAARRPGPPRNRPPNQTLPPRNLVICLTKLSHDAPCRTEARRYCGIHE